MRIPLLSVFLLFLAQFTSQIAFAQAPNAPEISFNTVDQEITIAWNSVEGATGYELFYAPFPDGTTADVLSADLGNVLSLSGEIPYGSAYYIAVQAYNSDGRSDYSNIEYFTLKAADVVQFASEDSDVNSIIYGDSGNNAVIFNGQDAPSSVVLSLADGTQGVITAGADGLLSSFEIDGYLFEYQYTNNSLQITLTEPDQTITVHSEELIAPIVCPTETSCYIQEDTLSLSNEEIDELEKGLDDTGRTFIDLPATNLASYCQS